MKIIIETKNFQEKSKFNHKNPVAYENTIQTKNQDFGKFLSKERNSN